MGTRSLVHFQENGETFCTVYQQFDGYPDGVGKQIFDLLDEVTLVNGIPCDGGGPYANGVGCLAAQYIARHKEGAGGLYLYRPDANDCWEEYTYFVNVEADYDDIRNSKIKVTISVNDDQFVGTVEQFGKWIENPDED